ALRATSCSCRPTSSTPSAATASRSAGSASPAANVGGMRRVLGLSVVIVAVAGCGSSGVTKSSYAKRANAICARYTRQVNSPNLGEPTKPAMRRLLDQTVHIVRKENSTLRRLEAPGSERKDVRAMLAARDALVNALARNRDAIAALA